MSTQTVSFVNSRGRRLSARLELPAGTVQAYAVFAHCFICSKDSVAAVRISRALAERGIGVLRFDFTGVGESEGDFSESHFSANVEDVVSAAQWLRDQAQAPCLLIGHSLGGAAVLIAATQIPEVRAVTTIAAPSDPAHVTHLFAGCIDQIRDQGEAEVSLGIGRFRVTRRFLEDVEAFKLDKALRDSGRALLIMHAPGDTVVEISHARSLFEQARHPKSFVSLDDADHLLTRRSDAQYTAHVISAWVSRYLPDATAPAAG